MKGAPYFQDRAIGDLYIEYNFLGKLVLYLMKIINLTYRVSQ